MCRQDPQGQQQGADALREQLRWLEGCFDSNGPFFMGEQFSLVDISILPFFLRLPVLSHYRAFALPKVRYQILLRFRTSLRYHSPITSVPLPCNSLGTCPPCLSGFGGDRSSKQHEHAKSEPRMR